MLSLTMLRLSLAIRWSRGRGWESGMNEGIVKGDGKATRVDKDDMRVFPLHSVHSDSLMSLTIGTWSPDIALSPSSLRPAQIVIRSAQIAIR
jgi:hypothetical protein